MIDKSNISSIYQAIRSLESAERTLRMAGQPMAAMKISKIVSDVEDEIRKVLAHDIYK